MNKNKIAENLIHQTSTLIKSYERVAMATGSNFNIFSILNVETDEQNTHSKFIAYLLSRDASHGYCNLFLKKFLETIGLTDLDFNPNSYVVHTEYFIGFKNEDSTHGGKIDILLIDDKSNTIIIENKIYASEQHNQLLRYRNAFPNGKILFLNLDGTGSTEKSSENIKYDIISYKKDIVNWIDHCQKLSVDNPVIRETLKQYKNLIKKLTLQNTNSQMNEELIKIVLQNKDTFSSYIDLRNINIQSYIIENKIKPILSEIAFEQNLELQMNFDKWSSFVFINDNLRSNGIGSICFSSSAPSSIYNIVYGYLPLDSEMRNAEKELKIKKKFNEYFDAYSGSGYTNWIALGFFNEYKSWEDFNILSKIYFNGEAFKNIISEKVSLMLKLIDELT